MSDAILEVDVRDGVAWLTLNRPQAGNAIDIPIAKELLAAAERCERDSAVRAVVITGAGKMFCAGGDLRSFAGAGDRIADVLAELTQVLHAAVARLARMRAPVIAAVNGAAAGAGMSLACAADLVIAAESAHFTMAYTAAGLTPDGSSTYFLPRLVGPMRARELMLTNRRLTAAEALAWGMVTRVVPDNALLEATHALARSLADGPTLAYGATKLLVLASALESLEAQLDLEAREIVTISATRDSREGIAAFLAKRRPTFGGE
jgi:2-(1,2-epoxy-1,2-dihydrophenyl)acetyl-CoA isomerase